MLNLDRTKLVRRAVSGLGAGYTSIEVRRIVQLPVNNLLRHTNRFGAGEGWYPDG